MRRSVKVVLSSMLRLSWLRSLSWASCSWSSERRNASGRGSSSVSRPSSSLRTSSISCSSSPRTTWTSLSAWASLAQYSSASARVFPTCGASVKEQKTGIRLLMNNKCSWTGSSLHVPESYSCPAGFHIAWWKLWPAGALTETRPAFPPPQML